jgi:cytochrome P450
LSNVNLCRRNYIKKLAAKCVEARKNNPEELKTKKDLLTLLINAEDNETGEKLKDDQIVQEAIIFMLAGHETTAHCKCQQSFVHTGNFNRYDIFTR